jgi:hypothetical protein
VTPTRTALKEWAVVIAELREGRQILLLRKGGIHDRGGEFRAIHDRFFLFPTFEHQKSELLVPEAIERHRHLLDPAAEAGPLSIDTFAEVRRVIELDQPGKVRRLGAHHLWSERYIDMRLGYRPQKPLVVLLLGVHLLPEAVEIPRRPRYAGCRAWVELEEELDPRGAVPALDDAAFAARAAAVEELLR